MVVVACPSWVMSGDRLIAGPPVDAGDERLLSVSVVSPITGRWIWIPLVITKLLGGGDRLINLLSKVGRTAAMAAVLGDGGGASYLVLRRSMALGASAV
ncbi:hypothetical protein ACLOJK_018076 [Asimina triloba]